MDELKYTCPVYRRCGGCQLLHLPYEKQIESKQEKVNKLFRNHKVNPIIYMEKPLYYRNKVHAAFGTDRKGKIIYGPYEASTHKIVSVKKCLCEDIVAQKIIKSIALLTEKFKLSVYDEDIHRGFLRHVLIRRGFHSQQVMVVLVTGEYAFPRKKDFIHQLLDIHPEITTIVQNINNRRTSMILSDKEVILYGTGYIMDELMGKTFRISASSFYQVNPIQTVKLYQTAIEMAKLKKTDTVIDAYSGIGTISLLMSSYVDKVIGVELNKAAVKDAIMNAKMNRIRNCQFIAQDAGEFLQQAKENNISYDVVIMDPPRTGSSEAFLSSMCDARVKKIVYISCNPVTQKRDVEYLYKRGYRIQEIQPVDMFPFTEHTENIILLKRTKEYKSENRR